MPTSPAPLDPNDPPIIPVARPPPKLTMPYRAYLLKEQLRAVFAARDLAAAKPLLIGWLAWAARCRLPAFVKLAKTVKKFRQLILDAVEHGLSNARSEATNTHLRLLTRRSYGLSPSPSWPWPNSPAAASAHPFQAEQPHDHNPQKRQESRRFHPGRLRRAAVVAFTEPAGRAGPRPVRARFPSQPIGPAVPVCLAPRCPWCGLRLLRQLRADVDAVLAELADDLVTESTPGATPRSRSAP